jgi:hypothetical protein
MYGAVTHIAALSSTFHLNLHYHHVVLQPRICRNRRGLGSSPFARHYLGNHLLFSSPGGNEMFQFPPFASLTGYMSFTHVGCPIRKSSDQGLFAASRSLSQLITSFFASESQGIRHAPLLTFFLTRYLSRISHTMLFTYFTLLLVSICQRSFCLKKRIHVYRLGGE